MSRLLPISGKKLCVLLERCGFEKVSQKGSHCRYAHPDGRKTVVPVHANEVLGIGLLKEILSQCKISRATYLRLRKH